MFVFVNDNSGMEKLKFPVLLKNKCYGAICLFSSTEKGVILVKGDSAFDIGDRINTHNTFDLREWEIFSGEVTLRND